MELYKKKKWKKVKIDGKIDDKLKNGRRIGREA